MFTKAEINLNALTHNLNVIKSLSQGKDVLAVVKANAYGHGIDIVAPHLHKFGVRHFAVSSVDEADTLNELISGGDILILGTTPISCIDRVNKNGYIQAAGSVDYAKSLPKQTRTHIKIDTGMTRFGINTAEELIRIRQHLRLEAIFTHFPVADSSEPSDVEFTINQQAKLVELSNAYKFSLVSDSIPFHSQNSAGVFNHRDFGGCMVRTGLALYGYFPGLKQVMTLKSQIAQIRQVEAGVPVGYGRSYTTESPCTLAVVPVGYADGYSRLHSNKGRVVIRGEAVPIRGRVCMDYIIVDVTGIDGVQVGDEVQVYGSISEAAQSIGTIPYEITCAVSSRVERVAVDG